MYISPVLLSGSHPIIYIFLSFALPRHIEGAVFEDTAGYWNSFRTF
jgi:hypothetical protein